MCQDLAALQQSIVCYASRFDAYVLTPAQAGEVVRLCGRLEASIGSLKALAAVRSAEGNDWKANGFRSLADQLAHQVGISPSHAQRTLKAGQRLANQPDIARAALSGDLSLDKAEAVSAGVEANPAQTDHLLDQAKRGSLQELQHEVAKIKAEACDQETRHRDQHARRSLRRWTDLEGALQAHLAGVTEDGPRLWRMLDPIRRRLNILRRDGPNPRERLDALDYDALMTMADIAAGKHAELTVADLVDIGLFPQLAHDTAPSSPGTDSPPNRTRRRKKLAGSPARVMIRVDLDTLLRGVPRQGELCEIAGYGPVPVSVVEQVLATDNPFLIGIMTKGRQLTGVYHHGRHPNAYQRSALDFLYPTCAAQGCSSKVGLQYDHRLDWRHTHYTLYDALDRLCPHHHRLKTDHGWNLIEGTGKRSFVPPADPRHPRHTHDANGQRRSAGGSAPPGRDPPDRGPPS